MKTLLLFGLLFHALALHAQFGLSLLPHARSAALAHSVLHFREADALSANPAGLADLPAPIAQVTAHRRFLLSDLQQAQAGAALPLGGGSGGLLLDHFGGPHYREQQFALVYGRALSPLLRLGLRLGYLLRSLPEQQSSSDLQAALGLQIQLHEQWQVATLLENPWRSRRDKRTYQPSRFTAGFSYQPSDAARWNLELSKEWDFPPSLRTGVEYQPGGELLLRCGLQLQPEVWTLGLGYGLSEHWQVDFAGSFHLLLGFSPTLTFRWLGREEKP